MLGLRISSINRSSIFQKLIVSRGNSNASSPAGKDLHPQTKNFNETHQNPKGRSTLPFVIGGALAGVGGMMAYKFYFELDKPSKTPTALMSPGITKAFNQNIPNKTQKKNTDLGQETSFAAKKAETSSVAKSFDTLPPSPPMDKHEPKIKQPKEEIKPIPVVQTNEIKVEPLIEHTVKKNEETVSGISLEEFEKELVKVLGRQLQVHYDQMDQSREQLKNEYERKLKQSSDISESEQLVSLRSKFTQATAALAAVKSVLEGKEEDEKLSSKMRMLWMACSNVYNQINFGDSTASQAISLNKQELLSQLKGDEVAVTLINSMPDHLSSINSLRVRFFSKLDKTCRNVGVFREEEKLSLGKLMWGLVEGSLTARCEGDQDTVPTTIYEILDKTAFHLRRGELLEAVVTLNQTTGPARIICQDWLADAREFLEASQTLVALMTHANAQNRLDRC